MHKPYPLSDHYNGKKFFNPEGAQPKGFLDVLKWQATKHNHPWPKWIGDVAPAKPEQRVAGNMLRVTLVNHATVLLQTAGLNILTDPMWSQRASPVSWIGPARHRAPGVNWEDLPPIDLVLLSHNHYDHCDLPTLQKLFQQQNPTVITALGVGSLVSPKAIEMDWWDHQQFPSLRITAVPAKHFSARGLWDRNQTLWCGFILQTGNSTIYFAGDTAFGPHFTEIRERFGNPRLALLPIGAYEPRWFMSPVHMSPEEAVQAHMILEAKMSIGIHFGTFALAEEGEQDPAQALGNAMKQHGSQQPFLAVNNGAAIDVPE